MERDLINAAPSALSIKTILDKGRGRPIVIVIEPSIAGATLAEYLGPLSEHFRVLLLEIPRVSKSNWRALTAQLKSLLAEAKIRHSSFVSFGAAGVLVQNIAVTEPKLVRSLIFINGSTRAHPTLGNRIVDFLEQHLPLGLPFRARSQHFDGMPFLHRIRCPVLLLSEPAGSGDGEREQSAVMAAGMPTAWSLQVKLDDHSQLVRLIRNFQDVPAKSPQ